jgi:hypothetical protein
VRNYLTQVKGAGFEIVWLMPSEPIAGGHSS